MQEYLFQFPQDMGESSETPNEPANLKPYDAKAEYPLTRLSPDKEKERLLRINAKRKVRLDCRRRMDLDLRVVSKFVNGFVTG